jgi:lipid-A-disaccharide synthase
VSRERWGSYTARVSGEPKTILFTGFEPSGDDHAAAVIAELKRRYPDLRIAAWGGPNMESAGAELIERTGDDAVVGLPGIKKILDQRAMNKRIEAWMDANPVTVHVPVDAPAANFPICAGAKKRGAKVVHLVAPQVWAWGAWRINKLRRLTDFVCCLLPFEESYFQDRGVPAAFVGHPLFDAELDVKGLDQQAARWPTEHPRIALMPGSRPAEIERNAPLLLQSFRDLASGRPGMTGVVAAASEVSAAQLREIAHKSGGWPDRLRLAVSETDAVIRWCDLALVVSGTVTLQIARQRRPMVIVYKANKLIYSILGPLLLRTPHFTLPNLIAETRVVPELVPHFGGSDPLTAEARRLLNDRAASEAQLSALDAIIAKFAGHNAAVSAATQIARIAGLPDLSEGDAPAGSPASI